MDKLYLRRTSYEVRLKLFFLHLSESTYFYQYIDHANNNENRKFRKSINGSEL